MRDQSNYQLTIAYNGEKYFGWQKTFTGPTIEETLQRVIETLLQQNISLQAASRTDRGVHALAQIVNFFAHIEIPLSKFQYRLNQLLPDDIRVLDVQKKQMGFHPSLDAVAKMYTYYIDNQIHPNPFYRATSFHVYQPLNTKAMNEGARHLVGHLDFRSFTNAEEIDSYRTIFDIVIKNQDPTLIKIDVLGDRFLYKMVRNLIGCLVYVGCAKISPLDVKMILEKKQRKKTTITAPAQGLFLNKVIYKESSYDFKK